MIDDFALLFALIEIAQWVFLGYFGLLALVYLTLNVVAFGNVRRAELASDTQEAGQRFTGLEPPISILVPAYNEAVTIAASVGSLMQLVYSEYEVIVINDGSQDATCQKLIEAFDLQATPYSLPGSLPTQRIRGVYTSRRYPNLRLIDKDNGGKADALNAGINAARYPLFCAVDADSILDRESLKRVARPFSEDPRVIASGGTVRLANGCKVRGGFLEQVGLPRHPLALIQIVEYLRAFLFGRMGWTSLNSVLIISGAFGLFRRTAVIEAGGYRHGTIGEDMELVVRLHRLYRLARKPYRIVFVPDPICWTEAPESLKVLKSQRVRWQQGLLESLWLNRGLLFHPRGGAPGWLAFPVMLLFEALGPIIEVTGYLFLLLGFALGTLSGEALIAFALVAIGVSLLLTASTLLLEELSFHVYPSPRDLLRLLGAALMENFGYRHLTVWWRLVGTFRWLSGKRGQWGTMTRKAQWQEEP